MDLSISIVSWNTRDLLGQCLDSVYAAADGLDIEVVVVDNASGDGSVEMVRQRYPRVVLVANTGNAGFAAANNQALAASTGRHFLLLNPDTICRPGALAGLVRFLDEHPRCGAVGPLVLNPVLSGAEGPVLSGVEGADETLQYSWARFPTFWSEARGRLDRRIAGADKAPTTAQDTCSLGPFRADWIGGCCLMVRRDAVNEIGPMDESLFMYCEETDWCLRLVRAGWEVWVEPAARIVHLGGQSSALVPDEAASRLRMSKRLYFAKHHGVFTGAALGAVLGLKYRAGKVLCGRGRGGGS